MKRLLIVAALLLGGTFNAQADTDTYTNITKHPRGDAELRVDVGYCAQRLGAPKNGTPTARQFKRRMLAHGWRFDRTEREQLYPDPENPGHMCRDLKMGDHVIGSQCSNF